MPTCRIPTRHVQIIGLQPIETTECQYTEGAKTMHGLEAVKRSHVYETQSELSKLTLLPTTYRDRRVANAWEEEAIAAGTPEPPHEVPRAYRLVEAPRPWQNADIYRAANRLTVGGSQHFVTFQLYPSSLSSSIHSYFP